VTLPLGLRAHRPGDRMRPRGGRGSRKLSDLFIDAKIPRPRRAELPVLVAGDGTILFVPGLRPAEAGRPSVGTRRWIQVQAR
jgi:tRNA(Ile)-lysidine synthase